MTMLLWKVFGAVSKIPCKSTFVTGRLMIYTLLLTRLSNISTMNALYVSDLENHQSCLERNWWLEIFCVY